MVDQTFEKAIFKQDYSKKPSIEGVKIVDIPFFSDDGGSFCELLRMDGKGGIKELFPGFELKQVNWSYVEPGLIKAGHVHKNQEDIWFVPPHDKIIVGLLDIREGSATCGIKMRFVLGGGRARLLYIPRGVVHGLSNPYNRPMTVIYLVNQYWTGDAESSDEWRIDYKEFGEGFWEMVNG